MGYAFIDKSWNEWRDLANACVNDDNWVQSAFYASIFSDEQMKKFDGKKCRGKKVKFSVYKWVKF